jgi:hypothetical protein
MTAMVLALIALAYPVVAGRVYRKLGAPSRCDGWAKGRIFENDPFADPRRASVYRCVGPWDIITDKYGCAECWNYRRVVIRSLLWPLWPVIGIPALLFRAGAGTKVVAREPGVEREDPASAGEPR